MMSRQALTPTAIALNRFGLGARSDETVPVDARRYLLDQFARFDVAPAAFVQLPDGRALVAEYLMERREARMMPESAGQSPPQPSDTQTNLRRDYAKEARNLYHQSAQARMASAIASTAPFAERMVHFWANHFCVSADNPQTIAMVGGFEQTAIRPHVLGKFSDMLMAVVQHPAMLIYLNQAQSIGPNSRAAEMEQERQPGKKRGLNENLAREIMELHTLGARSGYTQADVTEFARALTGWGVSGIGGKTTGDPLAFQFRPGQHEPGTRTIMGRTYAQAGPEQARAILADFAAAPQTAAHVATKLARHFAGDTPPQSLIDKLSRTFLSTGGDLPALYRTLVESPEAWTPAPTKFRTPWEWAVASLRAVGPDPLEKIQTANVLEQLGQPIWKPGSPAGWDDMAASWAAPDALLRRVEVAQRIASFAADRIDARATAPMLFPGSLDPVTAEQIAGAESPVTAFALLLVSPDMLRR